MGRLELCACEHPETDHPGDKHCDRCACTHWQERKNPFEARHNARHPYSGQWDVSKEKCWACGGKGKKKDGQGRCAMCDGQKKLPNVGANLRRVKEGSDRCSVKGCGEKMYRDSKHVCYDCGYASMCRGDHTRNEPISCDRCQGEVKEVHFNSCPKHIAPEEMGESLSPEDREKLAQTIRNHPPRFGKKVTKKAQDARERFAQRILHPDDKLPKEESAEQVECSECGTMVPRSKAHEITGGKFICDDCFYADMAVEEGMRERICVSCGHRKSDHNRTGACLGHMKKTCSVDGDLPQGGGCKHWGTAKISNAGRAGCEHCKGFEDAVVQDRETGAETYKGKTYRGEEVKNEINREPKLSTSRLFRKPPERDPEPGDWRCKNCGHGWDTHDHHGGQDSSCSSCKCDCFIEESVDYSKAGDCKYCGGTAYGNVCDDCSEGRRKCHGCGHMGFAHSTNLNVVDGKWVKKERCDGAKDCKCDKWQAGVARESVEKFVDELVESPTYFHLDDRIEATSDVQGLKNGDTYAIIDVDEKHTPVGNFVSYKLADRDGREFWVSNLHLLAKKVFPRNEDVTEKLHKKFAQKGNWFTGNNSCFRCGTKLPEKQPGQSSRICPKCWTPTFESARDEEGHVNDPRCWLCGKNANSLRVVKDRGPNYATYGVHRRCEYPDGRGYAKGRHLNVDRDWDKRGAHLNESLDEAFTEAFNSGDTTEATGTELAPGVEADSIANNKAAYAGDDMKGDSDTAERREAAEKCSKCPVHCHSGDGPDMGKCRNCPTHCKVKEDATMSSDALGRAAEIPGEHERDGVSEAASPCQCESNLCAGNHKDASCKGKAGESVQTKWGTFGMCKPCADSMAGTEFFISRTGVPPKGRKTGDPYVGYKMESALKCPSCGRVGTPKRWVSKARTGDFGSAKLSCQHCGRKSDPKEWMSQQGESVAENCHCGKSLQHATRERDTNTGYDEWHCMDCVDRGCDHYSKQPSRKCWLGTPGCTKLDQGVHQCHRGEAEAKKCRSCGHINSAHDDLIGCREKLGNTVGGKVASISHCGCKGGKKNEGTVTIDVCPECGSQNVDKVKEDGSVLQCDDCGTEWNEDQMAEETFRCQECGSKIPKGRTKCPKCGSEDIDLAEVQQLVRGGDPQDACTTCEHMRMRHRNTTGCDDCECKAFTGKNANVFTPEENAERIAKSVLSEADPWDGSGEGSGSSEVAEITQDDWDRATMAGDGMGDTKTEITNRKDPGKQTRLGTEPGDGDIWGNPDPSSRVEGVEKFVDDLLGEEFNRFDVADAHYWWLADHHGGQNSREYERLSKLSKSFRPGAASHGPESDEAKEIYANLCKKNGCTHAANESVNESGSCPLGLCDPAGAAPWPCPHVKQSKCHCRGCGNCNMTKESTPLTVCQNPSGTWICQSCQVPKKESVNEEVYFNTYKFVASHGKEPRGQGSWAFCPRGQYDLNDYLDHVFWVHGSTYKDAKAKAKAHFSAMGVDDVVVCP